MSFISAYASCSTSLLYNVESNPAIPGLIYINTTDTLAQVMATGYLNGKTLNPSGFLGQTPVFQSGQIALTQTSDMGVMELQINIDSSSNINIVSLPPQMMSTLITAPAASSASSLALGTAYHNTLGYDVMLNVYLSITASLGGSVLLGTSSTSTITQQTILPTMSLSALLLTTIPIYLPANYYAKLSTSGTITASIVGQICMPI
jgi:hypothetical protein